MIIYVECPTCSRIIHDPGGELVNLAIPCPRCGATGEARIVWPNIIADKYLEIAERQPPDRDSEVVRALLIASAIEVEFGQILFEIIGRETNSRELAESMLDEASNVEARFRVFKALTGEGVSAAFDRIGHRDFFKDWDLLRKKRNKVAHGSLYAVVCQLPDSDTALLQRVFPEFLKAFADLYNDLRDRARPASNLAA